MFKFEIQPTKTDYIIGAGLLGATLIIGWFPTAVGTGFAFWKRKVIKNWFIRKGFDSTIANLLNKIK